VLVALVVVLAACAPGDGQQTEMRPAAGTASPAPASAGAGAEPALTGLAAPGAGRQVTLYFASDTGRLAPEKREISAEGTTEDQARRVVEALMEGPHGSLSRVLPLGAGLRALYLAEDGIACVDLDTGFARGLSAGSEDALVAVWSLADTLAVNFPEVRSVKILIEGEEVRDLGGHLDLSRPLVPDMSLVDEGGGAPQAIP
jgi:spore germination protein GerM